MSKGDRSVTLDVLKISLWTDAKAYKKIEGARNADARLVPPWWMGYLKSCRQAQAGSHQALRLLAHLVGHLLSTWTVLHHLTTCESDCVSYEHQCGAQKHKCGASGLNAAIWANEHCRTVDDMTWKVQLTQPCERPWDTTHRQNLNELLMKSFFHHRGVKLAHWDVASKHPERDERLIGMDFAVRKPEPTMVKPMTIWRHFWRRLEYQLCASDSTRDRRSDRLPCKLSGRFRKQCACCEVQIALRQMNLRSWQWQRK